MRSGIILTVCFLVLLAQPFRGFTQAAAPEPADTFALYQRPGQMVRLPGGNRLSLYCEGAGGPAVILESGFGGGTYQAWHRLQHRIAETTRVCSYDRAGYGFSELGNDLPRDMRHDVEDLHALLRVATIPGPYLLVGHSDGDTLSAPSAIATPGRLPHWSFWMRRSS